MTLRNFHVDANMTDTDLLGRSDGFLRNFVASFHQIAANDGFKFGPITLRDADLNRVHGIVAEIDSRRLFYACGEDEDRQYAMQSLYETRRPIRGAAKGELLVQNITGALNDFCTRAEKLKPKKLGSSYLGRREFYWLMTDMRLKVWLLVAMLKKKLGSVINPLNLPTEIWQVLSDDEI